MASKVNLTRQFNPAPAGNYNIYLGQQTSPSVGFFIFIELHESNLIGFGAEETRLVRRRRPVVFLYERSWLY